MSGNRGIAQLMVLWALLLLGALAAGFSLSMRTEAQASRYGVDDARAYYQARTGISRAFMLLSTLPLDNVARMEIAGGDGEISYRVRVASESGKIDVNSVSEEDLLEILLKAGLPAGEAESVRDAVMDWKDADDDPRPRGAEFPEYAQLPVPVKPRNGELRTVGELRYVKGVSPELYKRFLSRVFTVHTGSAQVNVLHASGPVLESIPGVSPEAVAELLSRRGADPPLSPADLSEMLDRGMLTQKGLATISGKRASTVCEITATGRAGREVSHTVKCLVEIPGPGKNNVKILRWRDLAAGEEEG